MFDKLSGPQIEQKKKKIINIFKDCILSITVITNITFIDFLDLTLNLKTQYYQPFRKPNNDPIYIDINSNHPPQILKQLPKSISERSSENSSSKEVFDKSKTLYQKSLNDSGFYENLIYHQDSGNKNQHKKIQKRQRQIICFSSPFSKIVKTNIGKNFFKLINHHFPKHHKMSKIFNKNTIKLSYSSCRNMGSVIASHNRRIIQPVSNNHGCNCRNRAECPLDNRCLTANIVYKAVVSAPVNQVRNISILQKHHLKIAPETTQEIFATKNMLIALNFLNICGN